MSGILYYSNYCDKCKVILLDISKTSMKDDMHFICIDNRVTKNAACYVVLGNGQEVLLPPTVNKVPALLLLNRGHQVIFGDEITNHIKAENKNLQDVAEDFNGEPSAFALGGSGFGVSSDSFSFLDQGPEDLSAKGEGGTRQLHHYSSITNTDNIETPPDNYEPNTIKNVSLEQLQQERNNVTQKT